MRAKSQVQMYFDRKNISKPTESDWRQLIDSWDVENRGDYATYIPRWMEEVPAEDLFFVPYGRLGDEPLEFLREIEKLIGVKAFDGYAGSGRKVHASTRRAVPRGIDAYLEDKFRPQYDAIEKYLGSSFLEQC
jgi:hypothetical protein